MNGQLGYEELREYIKAAKKVDKKSKKSVDKEKRIWYISNATCKKGTTREKQIFEN